MLYVCDKKLDFLKIHHILYIQQIILQLGFKA